MPTPTPIIEADKFADPLVDSFWKDQWIATAVHNTEIYRKVFRCTPDDLVTSWASYKAFANHAEKFNKVPTDVADPGHEPTKVTHDGPGTHGAGGGGSGGGIVGQEGVEQGEGTAVRKSDIVDGHPSDRVKSNASSASSASGHFASGIASGFGAGGGAGAGKKTGHRQTGSQSTGQGSGSHKREGHGSGGGGSGGGNVEGKNKKPSGPNEAWAEWEKEEMEILLEEVRGHLGECDRFRSIVSFPLGHSSCLLLFFGQWYTRRGSWNLVSRIESLILRPTISLISSASFSDNRGCGEQLLVQRKSLCQSMTK
jgi:phospholipase D1/2